MTGGEVDPRLVDRIGETAVRALSEHAQGKGCNYRLDRWFDNGRSSSVVAMVHEVDLTEERTTKLVMKTIGAAEEPIAKVEFARHRRALKEASAPFADAHLAALWGDPIRVGDGTWITLQKVAGDGADEVEPMAVLLDHAFDPGLGGIPPRHAVDIDPDMFARACGEVVGVILREWAGSPHAPEAVDVAGFLGAHLDDHLTDPERLLHHVRRYPDRSIVLDDGADPLPNPFALALGTYFAQEPPVHMLSGKHHGDLHSDNVLVVARPRVDSGKFFLIDLAGYENQGPLTRDPTHFVLHLITRNLDDVSTKHRDRLIDLLLNPDDPLAPNLLPAWLVKTVTAVHSACHQWAASGGMATAWRTQTLLSLVGCALRIMGRKSTREGDKPWFLRLAARAAAEFVTGVGPDELPPPPDPAAQPVAASDTFEDLVARSASLRKALLVPKVHREVRRKLVDEEAVPVLLDGGPPGIIATIAGDFHVHQPAPRLHVSTPRQLPPAPAGFVGRVDQLAELDRLLTSGNSTAGDGEGVGATVVISAIGGIGKTWLILDWANRNLHRFPDGQLSVDLRGFSPTGEPRAAADVLAEFLTALGVDRDHLPAGTDARAALYRTHTANRRMLILLDNAATDDQVVPLLPGGDSCTVLITSRHHLSTLRARHSAHPVHMDMLTDTETRTLLGDALSDTPTTPAAREAVAELIVLCGGFPLALGLIAARIRAHPRLLGDIVAELRDLGLDALDSDDPNASLPAVLSWSLRHLTDQQRTIFGLLGIAPGPDIGLRAATSLTGLAARHIRSVLRDLADASLIARAPGNRYSMHDLVRSYATTTAQTLPEHVRHAALERVVDFYLHTALTADHLLHPGRRASPLASSSTDAHPEPMSDHLTALTWFDAEHPNLLAAQGTALTYKRHTVAWQLAWALAIYHLRRGHRHDRLAVWLAAVDASEHMSDPVFRIRGHRYLGHAYAALQCVEKAAEHLSQALILAERHGDTIQLAHTHRTYAWVLEQDDRLGEALSHARHALTLYRGSDHPTGEAVALNQVGWYTAWQRNRDDAREYCQEALTLYRRLRDRDGQAHALDGLGWIAHNSGRWQQSVDHYRDALAIHCELGNTSSAANTLDRLGVPYIALKQYGQALEVWQEALKIYQEQRSDDDISRVCRQLHHHFGDSGL